MSVVALIALAVHRAWREYGGQTNSGIAYDARALPIAGELVSELTPTGPFRYSLWISREGYVFAVSGKADVQSLSSFRQLHASSSGSAEGARRTIDILVGDTRIDRDFGASDIEANWLSPYGRATIYYRATDGTFTFVVQGLKSHREERFPKC